MLLGQCIQEEKTPIEENGTLKISQIGDEVLRSSQKFPEIFVNK